MEEIEDKELYILLKEGKKIENKTIKVDKIELENINSVEFVNCDFVSHMLIFCDSGKIKKPDLVNKILRVSNCSFKNCSIYGNFTILNINNIKVVDSFTISNSIINLFNFDECLDINYNINIGRCDFNEVFSINKNEFKEKGELKLFNVTIHNQSMISENLFNKLSFFHVDFKDFLIFDNNFKKNANCYFYSCDFEKGRFSSTVFEKAAFDDCKFHSTTWFENCKNLSNSFLRFISCNFMGYTLFDKSQFKNFEIHNSHFDKKVSFNNLNINKLIIHQVSFSEAAYFDDLNKNNNKAIESWDRKTLRAIKRELVNTHNQIDYLRFKAYELEAFKKEKDKSWKDNAILKLNSCSSKNGLDWFRGLLFTFIVSVLFFYLYSIIEVYDFWSNPLNYNFVSLERVKEYFFFLNPSDFDYHFDKLKSNKTNITIIITTIIFVFAKVLIGYGIYQTIQAFRKFGINGD